MKIVSGYFEGAFRHMKGKFSPCIIVFLVLFSSSFIVLPMAGKIEFFPFYRWDHFRFPGFTYGNPRVSVYRFRIGEDTAIQGFLASSLKSAEPIVKKASREIIEWVRSGRDRADLEAVRNRNPALSELGARIRIRSVEGGRIFEEVFDLQWDESKAEFKPVRGKEAIY